MAYFDFTNLIRKYMTSFTLVLETDGEWNSKGDWVATTKKQVTMSGAVISMRESRVIRSEGVYTQQDKALYMLEPLPEALHGASLVHDGKLYSIANELENSRFTGVWSYVLKFVSVFDGSIEQGTDDDITVSLTNGGLKADGADISARIINGGLFITIPQNGGGNSG